MDVNENSLDGFEPVAKIAVIGVGGAGNNAVNRMLDENIDNVEFYVANTDMQMLSLSKAPNRIILGAETTKGLGAGGNPEIGRKAAEESIDQLKEVIKDKDMLFIACGEGGGTGTGAAPVIAKLSKELGVLTVAIVTRPFNFEGSKKKQISIKGLEELSKEVDSIIIVSNDKLLYHESDNFFIDAFAEADGVLAKSVKTVADIILTPYSMNLDFADVRNILKDSGVALIGYGSASGPNKAVDAAKNTLTCPLLDTGIKGAKKCLIAISCGTTVTMKDINKAIEYINYAAGGDTDVKVALNKNPALGDEMVISVIATGFSNSDEIINDQTPYTYNENSEELSGNNEDQNSEINSESDEDDIIPNFLNDD